ncbi:MAG: VWA domain-containing protein [Chitinivibrionales bacterium]|nr:VWA domain-containing protein [Chitinivibrionales bacterium]
MRFKDPHMLWLLFVWVPMIWLYILREKRLRATVRFSDLSILHSLPQSPWVRMRHILIALRLIGVGMLIIALARPQKGNTEEEVSTEGVDIILVLDVSTSMKGLDFRPRNRLHVAKETIKKFIQKRRHDRIGLVVFAGRSYTKCPLTLDYTILRQFLDEVTFNEIEDGTAIGTAIATAANRIKDSYAKSKVIILLTDGANNRGEVAPLTAAEAAGALGIKIYTIGVGKEGKIPYPVQVRNPWTGKVDTRVQMVESELDEQSLVNIADVTKGMFFRAHNPEKLEEIYNTIDTMEKTEIKTKSYTTYSERFFPWLLWGSIILVIELILAHTRFRRVP